MSYTFLLAAGEESWAECFSGIPACALSRSSPTAAASSCNGNGMVSCPDSPSGTMCGHSTEPIGVGQLTLFAPESPARKCLEPTATQTTLGFSSPTITQPSSGSFARFDRHNSTWRTATNSRAGVSEVYSDSWPKWGIMQRGESWALEPLVCPTKDTASGSWPTPTATDYKGGTDAIRKDTGKVRMDLVRHVCKVRFGLTYPIPEHSEALMGWPIGWTDLKPLETAKFQQWLHSHGALSVAQPPKPYEDN